jgi:cephalosporin hydroxylase
MATNTDRDIVDRFHRLYYDNDRRTWQNTRWLGTRVQKCPLDLWVYQEILHKLRPDLIVETGTASGGSALFIASVCDLIGHGRVLTIDTRDKPGRPEHPRIEYVVGSSTAPDVIDLVRQRASAHATVLVVLDSDHSEAHVLQELRLYAPLVSVGSYLIVEDTNVNGHPVYPDFGPGPMEAVERFLDGNTEFAVDEDREKFFLTFNPRGFLRRVRPAPTTSSNAPG